MFENSIFPYNFLFISIIIIIIITIIIIIVIIINVLQVHNMLILCKNYNNILY